MGSQPELGKLVNKSLFPLNWTKINFETEGIKSMFITFELCESKIKDGGEHFPVDISYSGPLELEIPKNAGRFEIELDQFPDSLRKLDNKNFFVLRGIVESTLEQPLQIILKLTRRNELPLERTFTEFQFDNFSKTQVLDGVFEELTELVNKIKETTNDKLHQIFYVLDWMKKHIVYPPKDPKNPDRIFYRKNIQNLEKNRLKKFFEIKNSTGKHVGTCKEYSIVFYAIMHRLGIDSRRHRSEVINVKLKGDEQVSGQTHWFLVDSGLGFASHLWNEVKINGDWIFVDPTLYRRLGNHVVRTRAPDWYGIETCGNENYLEINGKKDGPCLDIRFLGQSKIKKLKQDSEIIEDPRK